MAESIEARIIRHLLKLSEPDLTQAIVIPLFRAMKYTTVEYHHGPSEKGRDVICKRIDDLGEWEVSVAQVKRIDPNARSTSKSSFTAIVTQLSQALEIPVPCSDKRGVLPTHVYLVTPYEVKTHALESFFEGYTALHRRNLKIIDGAKLAALMRQYLPELVASILGHKDTITHQQTKLLTNEILMRALHVTHAKSVQDFYVDIGLSPTESLTDLFFSSSIKPQKRIVSLEMETWDEIRHISEECRANIGAALIKGDIGEIQQDYADATEKYNKAHPKFERASATLKTLQSKLRAFRQVFAQHDLSIPHAKMTFSELIANALVDLATNIDQLAFSANDSELGRRVTDMHGSAFATAFERTVQTAKQAISEVRRYGSQARKPRFTVELDTTSFLESISDYFDALISEIKLCNESQNMTSLQLKQLLHTHSRKLRVIHRAISHQIISTMLTAADRIRSDDGDSVVSPSSQKSLRLGTSVKTIFDTGLNLFIWGEAGAGKTTTLQMYALSRLSHSRPNPFVLYFPLIQLVRILGKSDAPIEPGGTLPLLLDGMCSALREAGALGLTTDALRDILKNVDGVVLLDGLDEIISYSPWISQGIRSFSSEFANLQIIVSSRDYGNHEISDDFVNLSLCPFTEEQLRSFVAKWFGTSGSDKAGELLEHLSKSPKVATLVQNPLLATILCVLQERQIPLPSSEPYLYEERFSLLSGLYDVHKGIRRVISSRQLLDAVSLKIAFYLQSEQLRHAHKDTLAKVAHNALRGQYSFDACNVAVKELHSPCNILLTMSPTGEIGFGHLRFQEYLCARELTHNRSISLSPLIAMPWWKGCFIMLAKMSDSIEWIIEEHTTGGSDFTAAADTLRAMISCRAEPERSSLLALVDDFISLEGQRDDEVPADEQESDDADEDDSREEDDYGLKIRSET